MLASASDVDDLVPPLVAFQIEWNKLHARQRSLGWTHLPEDTDAEACARALGGASEDWLTLQETWGARFAQHLGVTAARMLDLRI